MRPVVRSALLAAAAAGVALAPSGAGAADATASAWWWRLQSGQVATLPPPPGVESDDLFVQGSPDGASAAAAVRFALDEGEAPGVLHLRFTEESAGQATAHPVVLACPTTTPWNPGGNQPWSTLPTVDCTNQAVGVVSEDGTAMTFDLSTVVTGDTVDVLIVPGTVEGLPPGANTSTFTLVFEAPEDTDLVAASGAAAPDAPSTPSATDSAASPSPASSSSASASSGGSGSFTPSGSTSSGALPSTPTPAAPPAPALPAANVAGTAPAPAATVPAFDPAAADNGDAKTLGVILLIGGAVATLVASRKGPLLQLLGGVPANATPAVAGLGRFARERDGTPPSLR
jgi:hypothetical protein